MESIVDVENVDGGLAQKEIIIFFRALRYCPHFAMKETTH